jgi:hypothetical protein
MNAPVRKVALTLLLVFLLPAAFYTVYELNSLSESEKELSRVFENQLDAILFSVNQYADDVARSWTLRIRTSLEEENLPWPREFLAQQAGLEAVFVTGNHGSSLRLPYLAAAADSVAIQAAIAERLAGKAVLFQRLHAYQEQNYYKLEPLLDSAHADRILLLSAYQGKNERGFLGLVLDSRAIDTARGKSAIIATCAMPVRREWLVDAGLGRERVRAVTLKKGVVRATLERVFARRALGEREAVPEGALAREAIAHLVTEGRLLKGARDAIEARLRDWALAAQLRAAGETVHGVAIEVPEERRGGAPSLQDHLRAKLAELGVESGEDAALLSAEDLLPPPLAPWVRDHLDAEYPRTFALGDAFYQVDYDLTRRQVVLRMIRGTRETAPPASYLPRFRGFRVCLESRRAMHVIRERG